MTTATLTLADFLLARIAEDEVKIHTWADRGVLWPHAEHDPGECTECDQRREHRSADEVLEGRLLAECEAKRRIVESAQFAEDTPSIHNDARVYMRNVLTLLAAVYADHPAYDEGWRP